MANRSRTPLYSFILAIAVLLIVLWSQRARSTTSKTTNQTDSGLEVGSSAVSSSSSSSSSSSDSLDESNSASSSNDIAVDNSEITEKSATINDVTTTTTSFALDHTRTPRPGSYLDTMEVISTSHMNMMGTEQTIKTAMQAESERVVADLAEGGQSVDSTTKHIAWSMSMTGSSPDESGLDVSCDSDDAGKEVAAPAEEGSFNLEATVCPAFYGLVGQTEHFVVDDEGNIAEASGPGSEIVKAMATDKNNAIQTNKADKISASNQLEQASRILGFLPDHPVRVNDEWDVSTDMGKMGSFSGTSTYRGTKTYNGRECAIIESTGSLHLEADEMLSLLGDSFEAMAGQIDMELGDSSLASTVYWDNENKISLYSMLSMSLSLQMDLGMGEPVVIPIDEEMTMTTEIQE